MSVYTLRQALLLLLLLPLLSPTNTTTTTTTSAGGPKHVERCPLHLAPQVTVS